MPVENRESGYTHFIEEIIREDMAAGKNDGRVATRFPPEPNGYLHIGHCKALWIDWTMARKFGGQFNLRFDDTNPAKEETEFVEGIENDIRWLGFDWDKVCFGSDYFDICYQLAIKLIKKGLAYVCQLNKEEMRAYRGTLTTPGRNSPYRDRSVEENLELFERMKNGEFDEGACVLRAKIDMASPNINLRDPALYRILKRSHHHTGDTWCIYPMYDFAHPIQDALEGITHSLCSLEYEAHRPLYDWVVNACEFEQKPRQIEFARLNLTRTIMSKRYLRALVETGKVSGWDDPRMPTLAGMRRRGYTPAAIRNFCERNGVSKTDSVVDFAFLEHCVREDLENTTPRAMGVLKPLRVVLTNWPEGHVEQVEVENHPGHPEWGTRKLPFTGTLYIEQDDFALNPPPKFFRLFPGGEVRLKGAYIIKCEDAIQDENGNVIEVRCSVDLDSKSGMPGAARKVKGTLHWVGDGAVPAEIRLYDCLLTDGDGIAEDGEEEEETTPVRTNLVDNFNADSIQVLQGLIEPSLAHAAAGDKFQLMRQGYFTIDPDSAPGKLVLNRIVSLKDGFKKGK
nr:glutamine--tRNA ligase/YqeY domain fusion protein [bacterium]